MYQITDAIERHPAGAFAAFLAIHAVVWTALPALFFLNLPLDLIEALVYGREWQLGYDKLPPLPWWMVEATYRLFGPDLFYYLLAQLTVVSAFALVWAMARPLVGPVGALVSILIIDGLHYFTFTAPKFNHDVIQLPFWALAGYATWAALRHGRMLHWVLLGLAIGVAFWAKYFVVVLAAPLALFVLLDRDARKALATPGPYVAAAVALVVMAPHLVWLVRNDFLPFAYAEARAVHFKGPLDYLIKPPKFLLSQLGFLVPSLLIAAPYLRRDIGERSDAVLRTAMRAPHRAGRRVRPPHRHAARLRAGADRRAAVARQRTRHRGDVGLSAVAVPRPLDRPLRAALERVTLYAHRRSVGRDFCRRRRGLRGHYAVLPRFEAALRRGAVSRRPARPWKCRAATAP